MIDVQGNEIAPGSIQPKRCRGLTPVNNKAWLAKPQRADLA